MPLIPPVTNSDTNPSANSMAVVKRILPPHSVPIQLNVLMADGTPIDIVSTENAKAEYGFMPLMNMWWPHTKKPRNPMPRMAYTMALYPKIGLRENVESSCDATPMPGRMAMYTSGCPKNQNRCCHNSGDPPLWLRIWSFTSNPAGRKKLVPARRLSSSSTPAASSTANPSKPRIAVTNQLQQIGRASCRERVEILEGDGRVKAESVWYT